MLERIVYIIFYHFYLNGKSNLKCVVSIACPSSRHCFTYIHYDKPISKIVHIIYSFLLMKTLRVIGSPSRFTMDLSMVHDMDRLYPWCKKIIFFLINSYLAFSDKICFCPFCRIPTNVVNLVTF